MIAYMPTIYPDELVYSWFCRYYVHSGCFSHKTVLQELYCKKSDDTINSPCASNSTGISAFIGGFHRMEKQMMTEKLCKGGTKCERISNPAFEILRQGFMGQTRVYGAEVISYNKKNLERELQNESRQHNKQQSKTKRREEEIY